MGALAQPLPEHAEEKDSAEARTTTFYELIEAIGQEVGPDDDELIVTIVTDPATSGIIRIGPRPKHALSAFN